MNVAGQSVMWLVHCPGCPLRIIKAQNRDEKKEAKPIAAAEVRRVYLEKAFAKRSTEVGNDRTCSGRCSSRSPSLIFRPCSYNG